MRPLSILCVAAAIALVGCDTKPPARYRWIVDTYLPAARSIAEASATRCGTPVTRGANPHPARLTASERDPKVLDVTVSCWRGKEIFQWLGENELGGPDLKRMPGDGIRIWSSKRYFLAGEFPEGSVTDPEHRSEYIDVPGGGKDPLPFVTLHVLRPAPSDSWIDVGFTISLE